MVCLLLTGCARTYIITLNTGERIQTKGKPRLVHDRFYYKNASGQTAEPIPSGRVIEVAPASMATPAASSMFKPAQKP